jgi:hemerythrin-like domain-containing protein
LKLLLMTAITKYKSGQEISCLPRAADRNLFAVPVSFAFPLSGRPDENSSRRLRLCLEDKKQRREMATIDDSPADARDMFAAHTMFRREFGLMPGLVRSVTAGNMRRTTLVADHVALVSKVLDLHLSLEDKHIWPRLRERGTREIASSIGFMEKQHETIHECLLQVKEALESWRESASAETRDVLASAIDRLILVTNEHLALEEERVIPLIEKYVTETEYALLVQEGQADTPPDKLPVIFGMMMYEGDPVVIDEVVAQMPAEIRPAIKGLATRAYAAYAEELYGTATPPRVTA